MSLLRKLGLSTAPPPRAVDRQLAMAVLLLEVANADFERSEAELATIRDTLASKLGLRVEEAAALVARGARRAQQAVSLHEFVGALNAELDTDGKRELLGWLWQVAHSDGELAPREEALIRQLADLLFLPHEAFIRTRLAVAGGV